MFKDEIGDVGIRRQSQSGWCPNEDMKVSLAPSFGAPGSHILGVVCQKVSQGYTRSLAVSEPH